MSVRRSENKDSSTHFWRASAVGSFLDILTSGRFICLMKRVVTKSMNVISTNPMTTANILNVTEGADFRVISLGSGTTIRDFIRQFVKHPLLTSPNKTSLGGEHVLATLHATKVHVNSYHLMYFQGTQDRHYHIGPRLLNIFASEPWSVFLGGTNLSVLAQDTIPFAEIIFPANSYTQLRFAPGMIHGFKGKEFAAISTHYTDVEEATKMGCSEKDVTANNVMEKLTTLIDSNKIKMIDSEPIHYSALEQLRKSMLP